jgi:hypothetical protein
VSHKNHDDKRPHKGENHQRGLGWPVKSILFLLAAVAAFFDHASSRWGATIVMAACALIAPVFILQFRRFWNQSRFWITVSFLVLVQIPLVIAVRPLIERAGSFYMLAFGIVDGLFVIVVIVLVCSRPSAEESN